MPTLKQIKDDIAKTVQTTIAPALAFLSQDELLKWTESLTQSAASIYDKALDAEYLRTHIGGAYHRMFDGGHDVVNAWEKVANASATDSFGQEVMGYASALWKDLNTVQGLPFVTMTKDGYSKVADWFTQTIPGVDRGWVYDLLSLDSMELLSTSLGVVSAVFFLKKEDTEKLAEVLGSMAIVSLISANPLMGIALVAITAYSYVFKKQQLDGYAVMKGATMAAFGYAIFSVLGLPMLVELVIVMLASIAIRKHFPEKKELQKLVSAKLKDLKRVLSKLPKAAPV